MTGGERAAGWRRLGGLVPAGVTGWAAVLAGAVVAVHLAVAAWGPYELHRDALLYLAMGEHLHLLRMDFPPFIAMVAVMERLLGDSLVVIHLGTALGHGALVVLAAAFARRADGGVTAQLTAAFVVATAPVYMRAGALFQPVVFDQLWWTLALFALARVPARPEPGLSHPAWDRRAPDGSTVRALLRSDAGRWALLGVIIGLGLLTKFTVLVLGLAILLGVAASPLRRWLASPWPYAAAALAVLVGAPSITGQVLLDWPFFNQFADLQEAQLSRITPLGFTMEQFLLVGPAVLIAAAGAIATLRRRDDPGLQAVAWTATFAFILMLVVGGKPYYIAPIWPALLGIGMAELGRWARALREARGTVAAWSVVWVVVGGFGVIGLPMGLPFLPPEPMARYAAWLGVTEAVTTNEGERLTLPQDYADMLGWEALADSVAAVYRSLPPEDRSEAVILATNYGRAGAIDFYTDAEVPDAVAPVGSYWVWGDRSGRVTVVVGAEPEDVVGRYFHRARLAARVRNPWGVPEEQSVGIVVARDPIRPLEEVWPEWRGRN